MYSDPPCDQAKGQVCVVKGGFGDWSLITERGKYKMGEGGGGGGGWQVKFYHYKMWRGPGGGGTTSLGVVLTQGLKY